MNYHKKKSLDQLIKEFRHYYYQRRHQKKHRVRRMLTQHLYKLQRQIRLLIEHYE
ncbi:hypothetical protein IQ264_04475 [Phormidium sp. LEGE 05292]|uniref:hypothetical protein n=1 Tax=[Phormidium] sp. LEGE 05292 TaxID=767427 RepID=UPI0018804FA5|nr:hypothetical protein [Phormidium sp. LEGE 05292]MBE9224723.1 hypothetical protein [Phormidium sp. LEGE 05292]